MDKLPDYLALAVAVAVGLAAGAAYEDSTKSISLETLKIDRLLGTPAQAHPLTPIPATARRLASGLIETHPEFRLACRALARQLAHRDSTEALPGEWKNAVSSDCDTQPYWVRVDPKILETPDEAE
ncbi:hypothetical protein HNP46_000424 [Pseudomonas nitritireducens]|uniref:Uncharacterized protein n=1 Tax=Pseudomonas nitroreducens TaxID=46680 RepID=A0A7W7KG20_PSENT|nr:hypothetical protein [Pseudomonas nitritireducens]MBB4861613.1 hypothetical protein [Pseudomonas nitritireducens]